MQTSRTHTTHRLLVVAALGLTLVLALRSLPGASLEAVSSEPAAPSHPKITYPTQPAAEHADLVDWAIGRYIGAGLELPDLTVTFPDSCGGKAGRYLIGTGILELCTPNRTLVLHEMAHAWEDVNQIDRDGFMKLRGVDHWYEHECEHESSKESGGEQLAIIMTWGLHEVDTSAREIVDPKLPIDQQPRYLPGLDDSDPESLREAFRFATGVEPLVPA